VPIVSDTAHKFDNNFKIIRRGGTMRLEWWDLSLYLSWWFLVAEPDGGRLMLEKHIDW